MPPWLRSVALLAGAALLGVIVHAAFHLVLVRIARRTRGRLDDALVRYGRAPARLFAVLVAVNLVEPAAELPPHVDALLDHALNIAIIVAVGWLAIALTRVADDLVQARYELAPEDVHARRVRTQFLVFRRLAVALILVCIAAGVMVTFPRIRSIGTSLFASAGLAGIIAGMAARPALSNLIAGVQLALTEPIRIGDAVIVESEFGNVEEIGSSFVIVKLWDLRRMVVPLSYFIEKPFQNWTREAANLLGTVEFKVDWSVPVDDARAAFDGILRESGLWDGRASGFQVTDLSERTMTLRALVSAADGGKLFDLRCVVREKMIGWLQRSHPNALPKDRIAIEPGRGSTDAK